MGKTWKLKRVKIRSRVYFLGEDVQNLLKWTNWV